MNGFLRQGFCFTGKGLLDGKLVKRADLEAYLHKAGGYATDKVTTSTDVLVASRTDTTKAKDAISQGKRVITYDEFFTMAGLYHHDDLGLDPLNNAQMNSARDQREAQERVDAKRAERAAAAERKQAALDEAAAAIPGWGMF